MLPPWSQALLRAARMGQVQRPPAAPVEEEKDTGEDEDAEGDVESGFLATKWSLVPSHLEGKEIKFLADRRNGLPPLNGGPFAAVVGSSQTRKTKIKKTDSAGNVSVLEVLLPEGQAVQGEIVEEGTTLSEPPAPGTVVEGVGVVNAEGLIVAGDPIQPTPPRRRPPPPRRRPKGPGRGRKKKVAFAPGVGGPSTSQGATVLDGDTTANTGEPSSEGNNGRAPTGGDAEMEDDSMLQDGSEGSEEEEDGEDGDREEGELSPTPMSISKSPSRESAKPEPAENVEAPKSDIKISSIGVERDQSSSPDLPLAAGQGFPTTEPQIDSALMHTEIQQSHVEPPQIHVQAPGMDVDPPLGVESDAVPDITQIPASSQIIIEDADESTQPITEAELPPEHNPLDGLTQPEAPVAEAHSTMNLIQFPDGEEDLLGSLERHLDKQG